MLKAPRTVKQILTPTTVDGKCPTLKASSGKGDWNQYLTTATGYSVPGVFCIIENGKDNSTLNKLLKKIVTDTVTLHNEFLKSAPEVVKFLYYMFVLKHSNSETPKPITNGSVEYIRDAVLSLTDTQTVALRATTPRERFRLMGVEEKDIDKLLASDISNSQLYKMAGNSIAVPVIEGIFANLIRE